MSHSETLNSPSGDSNNTSPEADGSKPIWSIRGGNYDPDDPLTAPDPARLEEIRLRSHTYSESAGNRFWALDIVSYALELSHPRLDDDPDLKHTVDHDLNNDFAVATKSIVKPAEAETINLLSPEQLKHWPLYQAISSIISTDELLATDPYRATQVDEFARLMISYRDQKQ